MSLLENLSRLLRPRPKRKKIALVFVNYLEGDRLIRLNEGWELAPEEDGNHALGMVWLQKLEPPQ